MTADGSTPTYVDTPYGLVTAAGHWYHIPEAALREYAGEVLSHVSLEALLRWADAWLESPRTVTLWALPLLLWGLSGGWAVGAALGLYLGWALASPAFPYVGGAWAVAGLGKAVVQGGYYVLVLSAFAAQERFAAVGIGLGAFVLFRWGVIDWVGRTVLRPVQRRLYPLPVADQVLRGLIVRAALKHRVSVPQVDALTSDILENWGAHAEADTSPSTTTDESSPDSHA